MWTVAGTVATTEYRNPNIAEVTRNLRAAIARMWVTVTTVAPTNIVVGLHPYRMAIKVACAVVGLHRRSKNGPCARTIFCELTTTGTILRGEGFHGTGHRCAGGDARCNSKCETLCIDETASRIRSRLATSTWQSRLAEIYARLLDAFASHCVDAFVRTSYVPPQKCGIAKRCTRTGARQEFGCTPIQNAEVPEAAAGRAAAGRRREPAGPQNPRRGRR